MEPSLRVNADRASQFTQKLECPISMENMTQAVTLMPCSHTYDERSIQRIPGFGSLEAPAPCEGNSTHITKVRMVNRINCPLCTTPVKHYYRNWALREVCQEIPSLFGEEKTAAPESRVVSAPKGTLKDRFEIVVGGVIAGFLSLGAVAYAMEQENQKNNLRNEIKAAQANAEFVKGVFTLFVIAVIVCACVPKK